MPRRCSARGTTSRLSVLYSARSTRPLRSSSVFLTLVVLASACSSTAVTVATATPTVVEVLATAEPDVVAPPSNPRNQRLSRRRLRHQRQFPSQLPLPIQTR